MQYRRSISYFPFNFISSATIYIYKWYLLPFNSEWLTSFLIIRIKKKENNIRRKRDWKEDGSSQQKSKCLRWEESGKSWKQCWRRGFAIISQGVSWLHYSRLLDLPPRSFLRPACLFFLSIFYQLFLDFLFPLRYPTLKSIIPVYI